MHRLISARKLLIYATVAVLIFITAARFVPSDLLTEILNGVFLAIVCAVSIVFFPLFVRSIRVKNFDRVSQLTIGILLAWSSLIVSRGLSTYVNAGGDRNKVLLGVALVTYLGILSGILHITAPGMVEDKWKYNKGLLLIAGVIGSVIGAATIWFQRAGL